MGTLSKRGIEEFGVDVRERIEGFRSSVGRRIDRLGHPADGASRSEGPFTRRFEKVTSALPSTTWLALAGASAAGSIGLKVAGRTTGAIIVATLVPAFLVLGLYNRLVKVAHSDRHDDELH